MEDPLHGSMQLPVAIGDYAREVDGTYATVFWLAVATFTGIVVVMLMMVWRYRRRPGVEARPTRDAIGLELAWTVIPVIPLAYLFHLGWTGYLASAVAPEDAIDVRASARMWSWDFNYPTGSASAPGHLVVPAGEPVRLIMTSEDVIHSFFVPTLRLKRDVVPGMYTSLWFETDGPTPEVRCEDDGACPIGFRCSEPLEELHRSPEAHDEGELVPYRRGRSCEVAVFCAEYCGLEHSRMMATIHVVPREVYDAYVDSRRERGDSYISECADDENRTACVGQELRRVLGCSACHGIDGEQTEPAPNWAGLWMSERTLDDGTVVIADEDYIRRSLTTPRDQIVSGYSPIMPAYPSLREWQLEAILAYIQTIEDGRRELSPR